jgi:hypothetical protein
VILTGGVEGDRNELEEQLGATIIVLDDSTPDRDSVVQAIETTLTSFRDIFV